jgi:hypothetical protein
MCSLIENSDGSAVFTVSEESIHISKETIDTLKKRWPNLFTRVIKLVRDYPSISPTAIHSLIMKYFPQKKKEAETKWAEHIKNGNQLVIMHVDDNKLNFNIDNLLWGPGNLNRMQVKCFPIINRHGKWTANPKMDGKQESIKSMSTKDEAKHQLDIHKILRAPEDFREYLFTHAMHKPEAFSQYYTDIPTLLSREVQAKKLPQGKRGVRNTYLLFSNLDEFYMSDIKEDLKTVIRDIFSKTDITPFDSSLDYVVYTKGGRGKEFVFLIEKDCYARLILQTNCSIGLASKNYILMRIEPTQKLHVAVMNRHNANDSLLVRHGPGEALDNRKRTLRTGTHAENMGDRGIENQASRYLGVVFHKTMKKWMARIGINYIKVYLGAYDDEEEAGKVSLFAQRNRAHLTEATEGMSDEEARKYVREFCRLEN